MNRSFTSESSSFSAILKISSTGVDYTGVYWDSSHTFDVMTKGGTGAFSGGFASLDTSGAGSFSADGSWSLATGGDGTQQAVWTAASSLMGGSSSVQAVPEPGTYGLLGAGALAAAAIVRRRRRIARNLA